LYVIINFIVWQNVTFVLLFLFAAKNLSRHVERRKCCRLSSDDDRQQFITLGVHCCVQHDWRDAARRAGSSASAKGAFISPYVNWTGLNWTDLNGVKSAVNVRPDAVHFTSAQLKSVYVAPKYRSH